MIGNTKPKLFAAVILMFITIASFTVMAVGGRYVSDDLSTFEIMMYLSLIGFLLIFGFLLTKKG